MSSPGIRSRTTAKLASDPVQTRQAQLRQEDEGVRLTCLDVLRMLAGLALLSIMLSFFITRESLTWNNRPAFTRPHRIRAWLEGPLTLTDAQLSLYNGTSPALPILLGLNGSIYDVSASPQTYGPGGAYHFFAGRDAVRAFVTGCFDSDLNGDLRGVETMFVAPDLLQAGSEGQPEQRRQRKLRREQELRLAHRRVRESIDGWRKMFDGGKGGAYFWRGTIDRGADSGWPGWGEVKPLCERARERAHRREASQVGQ